MSTEVFASNQLPVSRKEAIATGQTHYFTGKPCKRGHLSARLAKAPTCMQCNSEKSKTWSAANPDKSKFYRARWEANNLQKRKDQAKVWISQNPDKIKANDKRRREKPDFNAKRKARYEANPRPYILAVANRRGKSNAAEGRFTDDDIIRIRNAQKDKCAMCRVKLHGKGHIDHITALIKGGSNWPRNLQLLCKPCNCSKKDRHPIVFAQSRGLLL